jgi:hypothetical protein
MALSNPYEGKRLPGYVGQPLPGIVVKLMREDGSEIPEDSSESGELLVSGKRIPIPSDSCAVHTLLRGRSVHVFPLHQSTRTDSCSVHRRFFQNGRYCCTRARA